MQSYHQKALKLLADLIRIPSFSKQEEKTAEVIYDFLNSSGVGNIHRKKNNVWVCNERFIEGKPTILINSHHDTVRPNSGYTNNPYEPIIEDGKLYGLGSNDAGGSLVALIATFQYFYRKDLPFNLVLAATAEEENSGRDGIEMILEDMGHLDYGIIGEPTEMAMAVAEKGLMVLDCYTEGQAGHAARDIGKNAIYEALDIIKTIKNFKFKKESDLLGPVKLSVTQISAGSQHNVIPDRCHFVIDVRTTDAYTNNDVLEIIRNHFDIEINPRSTRLNPSFMSDESPIIQAANNLGIKKFGSPTTSDQAVIPIPTVKMGPGKSERSHTPNEFIFVNEISSGIDRYIGLLEQIGTFI